MIKYKEVITKLVLMFVSVLAFTFLDWLVHSSSVYLSVPYWYYTHKIIYGTLLAFLGAMIFRKLSLEKQSLFISLTTVVLLQIRYAMYGYSLFFHSIILPTHFIILYLTTWSALKIGKKNKLF